MLEKFTGGGFIRDRSMKAVVAILYFAMALILLGEVEAFKANMRFAASSRTTLPLRSSMDRGMTEGQGMGMGEYGDRPERSKIPQRKDTCKVFISGVIGSDPREAFLSNGHYVMNFGLAVVGHFNPLHSWEEYKPTETMWTNIEVWDELARAHQTQLTKGSPLSGLGTLILNKWQDKTTGEERKQLKLRLTHIMSDEIMQEMLGASGALDMDEEMGEGGGQGDFPREEDQSIGGFGEDGSMDDRIPF